MIAFSAPFVEPLLTGASVNGARAVTGIAIGFVFLIASIILDHERSD